ncbi:hypothetical protein Csa_023995, partial [Cucumis sativus]
SWTCLATCSASTNVQHPTRRKQKIRLVGRVLRKRKSVQNTKSVGGRRRLLKRSMWGWGLLTGVWCEKKVGGSCRGWGMGELFCRKEKGEGKSL